MGNACWELYCLEHGEFETEVIADFVLSFFSTSTFHRHA